MAITFDLSPEVEARVRKQAAEENMTFENYIKFLVAENLELSEEDREKITVTSSD